MPRYTVTWPTRPAGVYSIIVRATDPTDAARVAADEELPTTDGYSIAYDYEPEIWRIRRPHRLLSRRVQGPSYSDTEDTLQPFVPVSETA
jgi:hypothetical protein